MSNETNTDTQENEEYIKKLEEFAQALDNAGLFPRSYDLKNLENLFQASQVVHKHLCTLDSGYYKDAREVKLVALANAYASISWGMRELE